MKINEIQLTERATEEHRGKVATLLKNNGYKKIGGGADMMVYSKYDNTVLKVIFPTTITSMQSSIQLYVNFYKLCRRLKSPHLPKFYGHQTIEVDGEKFYQIIQEKLLPIPKKSLDEAIVWALSDIVGHRLKSPMSWEEASNRLLTLAEWKYFGGGMNRAKLYDFLTSNPNLSRWEGLYHIMVKVKEAMPEDFWWDLHTENVMQRADGTLVIVDPWV